MELTHSFIVPVDKATAWATFEDIAGVAECFPGAVVTSAEGDTFEGTCKVKLGPIALQYGGTGSFVERDEAAGRFVLDAKGKDKRGNGTAGAHVTASFTDEGGSSTKVEVVTDLQITGKPAQFGRGVIQDVSDKLLGQFVDCLQARIGTGPVSEAGPADATAPTDAVAEEPAAAPAAEPAVAPGPAPNVTRLPPPPQQDDALDLGATVLPILAKAYWKQAAGAALIVLVLWKLLRRR